MIPLDTTLYFSSINYWDKNDEPWASMYQECDAPGKFFINIRKRIYPCRFVSRNGEWSLPWNQELIPGFEMPAYDNTYQKTFSDVTDEMAINIKNRINQGEHFAVMYSGGIDSTVIVVALLKNLTQDELKNVKICCSIDSILEYPTFYKTYIYNKFDIIDSKQNKYDDLIERNLTPITADEGDCIFGTTLGLNLYYNYDYLLSDMSEDVKFNLQKIKNRISDPTVHYSEYKELIIKHLSIPDDPTFGRILYEKYNHNIKTASVPVHSLHDFFWWSIFNVKYLNCAVRGALYFNDRIEWQTAIHRIVNWYSYSEYQKWSMANNNNGQKIKISPSSYKTAAREYIWDFNKDDWYKNFKIKLESMWVIARQQNIQHLTFDRQPAARAALTKDYEMLYLSDDNVQNFFKHHLQNYKIDWM